MERFPRFRVPDGHRTHISVEFLERFPERPTDPPVKDHFSRRICEDRHARGLVLDGVLQDLHGLRSHYAGARGRRVEPDVRGRDEVVIVLPAAAVRVESCLAVEARAVVPSLAAAVVVPRRRRDRDVGVRVRRVRRLLLRQHGAPPRGGAAGVLLPPDQEQDLPLGRRLRAVRVRQVPGGVSRRRRRKKSAFLLDESRLFALLERVALVLR